MKYINFETLLQWFVLDFWKICVAFTVSAIAAVAIALSIPNEYRVQAKLMSNMGQGKALNGALAGLDGLASFAGISLGGEEMSPEILAEMMTSTTFLGNFAIKNNMAPVVLAAERFDVETEKFIFDNDIYDAETNTWTRDVKYPATSTPTASEVTEKLTEKLGASYDRKTQLVTVSYTSYSPFYALEKVNRLISSFNTYMQEREIIRLTHTVEFLNKQLSNAETIEVRSAIQTVLEEQFKQLALAETRNDFAFEIIEAPTLPYKKSAPSRALITIAISVFGTLLFIALWWSYRAFRGKYD